MRRAWKPVLLAVLFTVVALLVGGLMPPNWMSPSDRDYYVQR